MSVAAALLGGLAGLAAWLAVAYGCHLAWPRRFTFNPLYFLGAALTIETTQAYAIGIAITLMVSEAYALFLGALVYGFDAGGMGWLVGAIGGAALSVVSGATLAYSELLHRGVRSGNLGAPGMFAINHGRVGVTALVGWHMVFGLVVGAVYSAMA